MPSISIVVTTYNDPEVLAVCLDSLVLQKDQDFEVIVADDGSDFRTGRMIDAFRGRLCITHVWQRDEGFRVARARNMAIMSSRTDYIIFMDGDCFALPDFVSNHRRLAASGCFVFGKLGFMRPDITKRILNDRMRARCSTVTWFLRAMTNQCTRISQFVRLPDGSWRDKAYDQSEGVQACNLGVWREDILRVNGFNNAYMGWGLEDTDFVVRLIRGGVRRRSGDYACQVLHLDHERRSIESGSPNQALFQNTMAGDFFRTDDGIEELELSLRQDGGFTGARSRD